MGFKIKITIECGPSVPFPLLASPVVPSPELPLPVRPVLVAQPFHALSTSSLHCQPFPSPCVHALPALPSLTTFFPAPQVGPSFPDLLHPLAGEYENKGLMIIDEEEFLLILKLKDLKKQYRTEHQDLRDLRAEVQYCQHLVDQCRHRLLTGVPFGELGQPPGVPGGSGQGHSLDSRSGF